MSHTVKEIAAALGVEALGAVSYRVTGAAEPRDAAPDQLALAMTPAWGEALAQGRARAAVVWPGADWEALGLSAAIPAPRARLAMSKLTQMLDPGPAMRPGVHPTAVVDPSARIGAGACVGPLCVLGAGTSVDAGAHLVSHVTMGQGASVGEGSLLHPGVRIGRSVSIGARAILQPNAVVGSDGFSFVTEEVSNSELARSSMGEARLEAPEGDASWHRIHSLGGVEIGDDVEIGANSAVDAGTIRATRIGRGTKIDNLVQIGHNVVVGEDCLLCGSVGIAGSTVIGDRVVLGGMTGVVDNISIGSDVVTGAGTLVLSNVPAGRIMMGSPAVPMAQHFEMYKALRRLPRRLAQLARGGKKVPKGGASD